MKNSRDLHASNYRIGNVVLLPAPQYDDAVLLHRLTAADILGISQNKPKWKQVGHLTISDGVLLRCGFTEAGLDLYEKYPVAFKNDGAWNKWKFSIGEGGEPLSGIQFTHQLQNLYHSITGQELDIDGL